MKGVILAIGSNRGIREENILKGIKELEKFVKIKKISSFFENPPVNAKGGNFLNGAVEVKTNISPEKLLKIIKNIEKKLGRKIPHERGDEREIDIDIIFYGNKIVKKRNLKIPHPEYRKREFVLKPICEIVPSFFDVQVNKKIKEIYRSYKNENSKKNK
ncbi:MAG: 2-amino-4-hydroxy-6-hydroxymethyldihydropteridine diphosphokinase [Candidatus Omnitrophica bacterium]|nr:2-amino-4-hydroxy-6-hydroxymethyldihydropteridine diphosphokinase [Candidatus Omnitrophota bacterium]MCM8807301.1 2-amino-4-hydroxy-6-hydroxymethyldihydropteridine diphosphokinase [Candidatus Omnitrophota bacterium]